MKPEQRTRQEKIDIQLGLAGWLIGIRRLIRPGWAGQGNRPESCHSLRQNGIRPAQGHQSLEFLHGLCKKPHPSPRNLKYMRAFAEAWSGGVFVQLAAAQMGGNPIVQVAPAQLPWNHHIGVSGHGTRLKQELRRYSAFSYLPRFCELTHR